MASFRSILSAVLFLGLLVFASLPTRSTTIEKESLESIVRRADVIVWGNVIELQPSINFEKFGDSRVEIEVLQVIKGKNVGNTLWAEGCSDKSETKHLHTFSLAKFQVGEEVIVCLVLDQGYWEIAGAFQGKFSVVAGRIEGSSSSANDFVRSIQEYLSGHRQGINLAVQPPLSNPYFKTMPPTVCQAPCGGDGVSYAWLYHGICNGSNRYIRWGDSWIPPTIHINPTGALDKNGNQLSFSQVKGAIERAFQSWANVSESYLNFQIDTSPSGFAYACNYQCEIAWDNLEDGIGAEMAFYVSDENGYTRAADIVFNTDYRWNADDPNYPGNCDDNGPKDIQNIAAHEAGHLWGLDHVSDNTATMYYSSSRCDTTRRALAAGDIEGAVFLNRKASGTISSNVTWCSGTPAPQIHVIGNLTIASGVTLTIEPGAIVKFSNGVTITVSGTLNISGTSDSPVTFSGPSFTVSGSGSINVGYLTVPSGSTMAVTSGTALSFTSGAKLRINSTGVVSANGATFQGSGYPGSWFGIEFYNVTSGQSLGYCTIKDATYGLNFINTDVAFSSPRIRDNTYGVNCTNYSDPTFTAAVLQTNSFGAYGDASSHPYLGAYIGYNSFRLNDYYDIYSTYSGTIFARGNWWGACPPNPLVTGNVDYSSWLCFDPNPRSQITGDIIGMQLSKASTGSFSEMLWTSTASPTPEPGIPELDAACFLFADGKYAEALQAFEAIVARYPDNFAGRRALVFVERTLDKLGRSTEILATLNTTSASYSGKALGEFAKARRVYQYINQGRYQDAVAQAAEVVRLNDDTTLVKFALYDLGSIYWYYLGDTKTGEQYYRQLIVRFPKDHLTNSALATLGEWKPEEPSGKPANSPLAQSKEPPAQYALTQNYPNPFNPSTVISYQLPAGGYVTLKLYNTLGQEVATLVDGIQDAGFKSVTFDASRLPSGVYFYRLQSGTFIQNRKMLLVK